jgi:hypothetical protein
MGSLVAIAFIPSLRRVGQKEGKEKERAHGPQVNRQNRIVEKNAHESFRIQAVSCFYCLTAGVTIATVYMPIK